MENIRWISVVVAGHRSSYLQKLNCAAYCPWNFEAVIFPNIFNWFLYLFCFIYYHFPNLYRIITSCSAFVTTYTASSGSLSPALFSKYFQILYIFAQIFKYVALFCPFLTLFCPFSEKLDACPYFLE